MSMDANSCANKINSDYMDLTNMETTPDDKTYFLRILEKHIDDEFQNATPIMLNVDITTPAGSLDFGDGEDVYSMATNIGLACADYWSKTIEPTGEPQSCAAIVEVINTAPAIAAPITAGILALGGSASPITPPYVDFINIILTNVKTIIWTVTEHTPTTCDTIFTVTVT